MQAASAALPVQRDRTAVRTWVIFAGIAVLLFLLHGNRMVFTTDEGIVLRASGITARILVMCGLYPGEEEEALRHSLTPAVFRLEPSGPDRRLVARP